MNADRFKYNEITDSILRSFYEVYKATNIEVGLLLNFGRKPEFKRFVYDNKRKKSAVISVDRWLNSYKKL